MKILVLTRYSYLGSSSRYRIFQYLNYFEKLGWQFTIHSLLEDDYINYLYKGTKLPFYNIIKSYFKRIKLLMKKNEFDLIWLQQEAFPWIPAWIESFLLGSKTPIVVDYDDAFFHRYDLNKSLIVRTILGKKINKIMFKSEITVVGNSYLAERAIKSKSKRIEVVPTVLDLEKYKVKSEFTDKTFIIGWIGSPNNSKYVKNIERQLSIFCKESNVKVSLVGSGKLELIDVPYEVLEWDEKTESDEIKNFDVGIMPLFDSPWERGKCGFKLIQYMACGIPVVASPVGINKEIVIDGVNGFLAYSNEDWIKYFRMLRDDAKLRKVLGKNGRKIVEEKYSLQVISKNIIDILNSLKNK